MNATPSIWPALLAFAAVIALIPVALWVLKRLQGGLAAGPRGITLVGGLALGPRERVTVIEVEGRRFLIGVTAQSVNLIMELGAPARAASGTTLDHGEPPAAGPTAGSTPVPDRTAPASTGFSDLLTRLKRP